MCKCQWQPQWQDWQAPMAIRSYYRGEEHSDDRFIIVFVTNTYDHRSEKMQKNVQKMPENWTLKALSFGT